MLHAVLVGVNQYLDPSISPLRFACADVEAIAKMFEARIHPSERNVALLVEEQATKQEVMVAIGDTVARLATAEDIVFLYFAGHGSPETLVTAKDAARYLIM